MMAARQNNGFGRFFWGFGAGPAMFARVLTRLSMFVLLSVLAASLAGCGMMRGGAFTSKSSATHLRLPSSVTVDDGRNGAMPLQVGSLVDGGGLNAGFGSRGYSMGGNGSPRHDGIDILAANGAAVRAASDGRIVDLGWRGNYGRFILIRHSDQIETAYAHLSRFADRLTIGQFVRRNEVIGSVGTSGNATGPHLHFEVRRNGKAIDPLGAVSLAAQ
ncbi:MAG: putative metallopeptidase [Rhodospirillales bacterium]|nr:putative metallopeptidase [Rhodospirillales bacterium]